MKGKKTGGSLPRVDGYCKSCNQLEKISQYDGMCRRCYLRINETKSDRLEYKNNNPEIFKKSSRTWAKKNPHKILAQRLCKSIPMKLYCERCEDSRNLERHHPDYSKPLHFETLCRSCHKLKHRKNYDGS